MSTTAPLGDPPICPVCKKWHGGPNCQWAGRVKYFGTAGRADVHRWWTALMMDKLTMNHVEID